MRLDDEYRVLHPLGRLCVSIAGLEHLFLLLDERYEETILDMVVPHQVTLGGKKLVQHIRQRIVSHRLIVLDEDILEIRDLHLYMIVPTLKFIY